MGIYVVDNVMRIGLYYDDYSADIESGQPVLLRVDQKNRLIISPSSKSSPDSIAPQQVLVPSGGTPVPIPSPSVYEINVTIKALPTNTGRVYIGAATLVRGLGGAGNGYYLDPGEEKLITKQNIDEIYIDVDVDNDGVCLLSEGNQEAI